MKKLRLLSRNKSSKSSKLAEFQDELYRNWEHKAQQLMERRTYALRRAEKQGRFVAHRV
jgi:hypothetical protein